MFDNLQKAASDFGTAFGQIFDLSLSDYAFMNKISKPRVLSSKAVIKFSMPNFGHKEFVYSEDPEIVLGEIDDFSVKKNFKVIKRFKPFGHLTERVLLEDAGWDISWSSGKVDWSLAYAFFMQEQTVSGNIGSYTYSTPKYVIEHNITHYDGTIESYVFRDVTILGYEQAISGDNDQIRESVTAFSPERFEGEKFKVSDKTKITNRVALIIDAITTLNRS